MLNRLINRDEKTTETGVGAVLHVPLAQIDDNPYQKRQEYGDIEGLAQRIAAAYEDYPETLGLMQVPRGRLVAADDGEPVPAANLDRDEVEAMLARGADAPLAEQYNGGHVRVQLAFGHRRFRAFYALAGGGDPRYAGAMPVQLTDLSDDQMLDAVWAENEEREDLSEVEQAELMAAWLERHPEASQRDLAEHWGLSRPTVSNRLRLLGLPETIQQANRQRALSERQALALAPVAELAEKLNGHDVRWTRGKSPGEIGFWDPPLAPEEVITYATEHPDKMASDDIRDEVRKQLDHVGQPLHGKLATMELVPDDEAKAADIVQPKCYGCEARVRDHCLNTLCIVLKKEEYGRRKAQEVAEELELTYSDDPGHFEPYTGTIGHAKPLGKAFLAGSCDHLVVGFVPHGWAARPEDPAGYGHVYDDEPQTWASRAGVAIGCTHHPLGECAAPEPEPDPEDVDPLAEVAEQWREAGRKQAREIEARTKGALAALLTPGDDDGPVAAGLRALFVMVHGPKANYEIDIGDVAASIIKKAYGYGHVVDYKAQRCGAYGIYPVCEDLLRVAGLSPGGYLEDGYEGRQVIRRQAERVLALWGERRDTWSNDEYAKKLIDDAERLYGFFMEKCPDDEMTEWLGAALDEMEVLVDESDLDTSV